ncbi:MAG: ABC transporter permease, partial [Gammaproteobacteria bacterium]|nr:ABC transporter permease [Gammaproteobacteria bacterium]
GSTVPLLALGATAACIGLLAGCAALALLAVRRLVPLTPPGWRLGLRSATRHVSDSTWQVTAIGLGVMALLLLAVVRVDVLDEWQAELPPDAPNYFLINLQPEETDALSGYLDRQQIRTNPLYPMVRARLTALNGAGIDLDSYEDPQTRQLMAREFNLTWAADLQDDNQIVAGRWFQPGAREGGEFSVEADIAERMGIGIGDTLSYTVDGRTVSAPVTSIREVRWESFRPNFFVIASPGLINELPATWMTSFYLDDGKVSGVNDLVRTFPSVTVFAIDAILKQARAIVDRVTTALEFVYLFALISSAVVLLAALQATLDQRRYEAGLMKVFGATRQMLVRGAVVEPLVLGTVAGTIGGAIAGIAGVILGQRVFDVEVGFNAVLLPAGCLISWLVAYTGSFVTLRRVAQHPPGEFLRGR